MTDLQDRVVPAAPTVTEFVCNGSTVRVGDHPHLDALIYSVCDASGQCATGELTVAVLGDG